MVIINGFKTLQFGCYNEGVQKLLSGLNDDTCHQITELSLRNISTSSFEKEVEQTVKKMQRKHLKLVYILCRFQNLPSPNSLIREIARINTRHLFETCTKLRSIALCYDNRKSITMFQHIKQNCLEIENISLVRHGKDGNFDPSYVRKIRGLLTVATIKTLITDGSLTFSGDEVQKIQEIFF